MRTVTAVEAEKAFQTIVDAARHEPVVIRQADEEIAVLMSLQEYERLSRRNTDRFLQFCDIIGAKAVEAGMTEETLAEILRDEA